MTLTWRQRLLLEFRIERKVQTMCQPPAFMVSNEFVISN